MTLIETKEIFSKSTSFLRRKGIVKLGTTNFVKIEKTDKGVEICSGVIIRYYAKDGIQESTPQFCICSTIPSELIDKTLKEIKEIS